MREPSNRDDIKSYRDLRVWKEAMDLAVECYRLTKGFPREEIYGSTAQIRRSAASVPANIAEGYGRDSSGNCVAFLRTAQGSLKELETRLLLAALVGVTRSADIETALSRSESLGKMLRALIRSIRQSASATAQCRLPTAFAAEGRNK